MVKCVNVNIHSFMWLHLWLIYIYYLYKISISWIPSTGIVRMCYMDYNSPWLSLGQFMNLKMKQIPKGHCRIQYCRREEVYHSCLLTVLSCMVFYMCYKLYIHIYIWSRGQMSNFIRRLLMLKIKQGKITKIWER